MSKVEDSININLYCPSCGKHLTECKTKLVFGDLFKFKKVYANCNKCSTKSIVRILGG